MRIDLQENEHIVHTAVRHWWLVVSRGAGILLLFIIPLLAFRMLVPFFSTLPNTLPHTLALLGTFFLSLYALGLWMSFFTFWTHYYLDAYHLTNLRIIYVEQKSFFNREISSFRLDRIQDISSDTPNVIATLFRFGDIKITTASALNPFVMRTIPYPDQFKDLIIREMETHREKIK